jgi:hypothetical protein
LIGAHERILNNILGFSGGFGQAARKVEKNRDVPVVNVLEARAVALGDSLGKIIVRRKLYLRFMAVGRPFILSPFSFMTFDVLADDYVACFLTLMYDYGGDRFPVST